MSSTADVEAGPRHEDGRVPRSPTANTERTPRREYVTHETCLGHLANAALMGIAGAIAFGVFLTGADYLRQVRMPGVTGMDRIVYLSVSLSIGHSVGFYGMEFVQAWLKWPKFRVSKNYCDINKMVLLGLIWGLVLSFVEAGYHPDTDLGAVFYTCFGEFLGASGWWLAYNIYLTAIGVPLTDERPHVHWTVKIYLADLLAKFPPTFLVLWAMDIFFNSLTPLNSGESPHPTSSLFTSTLQTRPPPAA